MAKKKAKAKRKTPKRKTKPTKAKAKKKAKRKGTINAYARKTKEEIARDGKALHTNGFDLTDQQMLFVDKLLCAANRNQTKAAIAAGYSAKSAQSQASALMVNPRVKKYLRKRMDDLRRRVEVSQDKIVAEMTALALAKPSEFVTLVDGVLTVKDLDDIPLCVQGAIKGLKPIFDKRGDPLGIEVKFYDKVAAAKLLAQHLGMLDNKGRASDKGTILEVLDGVYRAGEKLGEKEE